MPSTAWSASQGCDSSDSRPVKSVPSPSASGTIAPSSGCSAARLAERLGVLGAGAGGEPVALALEGVGRQVAPARRPRTAAPSRPAPRARAPRRARRGSARGRPRRGAASGSRRSRRARRGPLRRSPRCRRSGPDGGRPRRSVRCPSRSSASTAPANWTVWRRLRYQCSASIVSVAAGPPLTVEYRGTSLGARLDPAPAPRAARRGGPRRAASGRRTVDGDPPRPDAVGLAGRARARRAPRGRRRRPATPGR